MNLKLNEIIALHYELNGISRIENNEPIVLMEGLLRQKTNIKLKYYLHKLANKVSDEVKFYEDQRKSIGDDINEINTLLNTETSIDLVAVCGSSITIDDFSSIETNEDYPIFLKLLDDANTR